MAVAASPLSLPGWRPPQTKRTKCKCLSYFHSKNSNPVSLTLGRRRFELGRMREQVNWCGDAPIRFIDHHPQQHRRALQLKHRPRRWPIHSGGEHMNERRST